MRKIILFVLFFISVSAAAQTPSTTYRVPTSSFLTTYFGNADRVYVIDINQDYVTCNPCVTDSIAGAGGRKWRKLPKSDTTSLSNRINLKNNISDTASMLSPYLRKNGISVTTSAGVANWNPATGILNIPAAFADTSKFVVRAGIGRPILYGSLLDSLRWDWITSGAHTKLNLDNATITPSGNQITIVYGRPHADSIMFMEIGADDIFTQYGVTFGASFGTDSMIVFPWFSIGSGGYCGWNGSTFQVNGVGLALSNYNPTTGRIDITVPAAFEGFDLSKYNLTPRRGQSGQNPGFPVLSFNENTSTTIAVYMVDYFGNVIKGTDFAVNAGFNIGGPMVRQLMSTQRMAGSNAYQQVMIPGSSNFWFMTISKKL